MAERTTTSRTLAAVILAAGKGKRLKSAMPKVLHPVCGKPALWHVLQLVQAAKPSKIVVVVGHGAGDVRAAVRSWGIAPAPVFVEQERQLGTGHAVLAAKRAVGRAADVLVANGDFDPVRIEDLRALVRRHRRTGAAVTIGSTTLAEPGGYARVVREGRRVVDVIEGIDATPSIRRIDEVATNWMVFRRDLLYGALPKVDRQNRQREYYLNRAIPFLIADGHRVDAVLCDTGGVLGLNSRGGLADVSRVIRARINAAHLDAGVSLIDPATAYVDAGVRIGRDSVIYPHTFLEGDTRIGAGCTIGPSTRITDASVGDGSRVEFAVVHHARIGKGVQVGPFARIRPGTELADGVIVGSYVEVKNSSLAAGAKVPHLSYVGDADVGKRTNIGAANVTANWDGYDKHRTVIGDDVRTGSDTIMVAPVTIGDGAVTGAGSVISKDVPAGALAVERTEQRTVTGYRKRKDAERRRKGGKGA